MLATGRRWFITEYDHWWAPPFFWIQFSTDAPCHLFCYITKVEPQKRLETYQLRGLKALLEPKWCFVQYDTNEQQEEGDTLQHTFVKPDWPICEYRYFGFSGTVAGLESPSVSPIFHVHRKPLPAFKTAWLRARPADTGYIRYSAGLPHMLIYPAKTLQVGQAHVVIADTSWHRSFLRFPILTFPEGSVIIRVTVYLYYQGNTRRGTAPQVAIVRHILPQDIFYWPDFPLTYDDWDRGSVPIYPYMLDESDPIGYWYSEDVTGPYKSDMAQGHDWLGLRIQGRPEDDDLDNRIDYWLLGGYTYVRHDRPDGTYGFARPQLKIEFYVSE